MQAPMLHHRADALCNLDSYLWYAFSLTLLTRPITRNEVVDARCEHIRDIRDHIRTRIQTGVNGIWRDGLLRCCEINGIHDSKT